MAPSGRVTRKNRTNTKKLRKPRSRIHYKKQINKKPNKSNIVTQEASSSIVVDQDLPSNSSSNSAISSTNCSKIDNHQCLDFGVDVSSASSSSSACSTPKAQRFRIPKIVTCPPAPKKQRVIPSCSIQRRPIAFFAPPDLELFFFFALRDISV